MKARENDMCTMLPLIRVSLLGNILSFSGKMYSICPQCGCTMRLTKDRYHAETFICTQCSYISGTAVRSRCFHCYSVATRAVTLSGADLHVCDDCEKDWMGRGDITAVLTVNEAHSAISGHWPSIQLRRLVQGRIASST